VNDHEGKAGMVLFAGKTVTMPERFECTTLAKKALYKFSLRRCLQSKCWYQEDARTKVSL